MKNKLVKNSSISLLFILMFLCTSIAQTANFTATPSSGCAPLVVNYSASSATTYNWSFGNGNTSVSQNPSATYSNPGTYTVTLTVSGGSSKTALITVYANPVAEYTTSALPSCVGQPITFTDASTQGSGTINSWSWDYGDGSPAGTTAVSTHSYGTSVGSPFPVSLTVVDNHGCQSTITHNVSVLAAPVARITASQISSCTAPLTTNFNSNTSTTTGTVTYAWSFGDPASGSNNTSTVSAPSHTFNTKGSYTVTLTITQGGCSSTTTQVIVINKIVAAFVANKTSVCVGEVVTFTDQSVPNYTTGTWNFGDASSGSSTSSTVAHAYAAPGVYTVSLSASDGSSPPCSDDTVRTAYITVNASPVVSFTADKTTSCSVPFTVNFTNTSTAGSGTLATYAWDFGDGGISSSKNPSHTYNSAGVYTVTLTVTNSNGCSTTLIKTNYIRIVFPVALFIGDTLEGCVPLKVDFDASASTSSVDLITQYIWDFGDGSTSNVATANTSHTYTVEGYFTVKLTIITASGCTATITKNTYIKAGLKPIANFSVLNRYVCHGDTAKFQDLSSGADSAYWQFGVSPEPSQGTFSTPFGATMPFNPVINIFPDTGTFSVMQIVYNKGCPDTMLKIDTVTINPPKPLFDYLLSCTNYYKVIFTNTSWAATKIDWYFGDGTKLLNQLPVISPSHTYGTRGTFTVKMIAYNSVYGCKDSITHTFTIAEPIAKDNIITSPYCYGVPVTFKDNGSQDAFPTIFSSNTIPNMFNWVFGDGTAVDTNTVATHTYNLPGIYSTQLFITDINGCKDTLFKNITVHGAIPHFTMNDSAGCTPLPVLFTDASVTASPIVQWTWNFGDGSTIINNYLFDTISHTYTNPTTGFYTVTMTVKDAFGCVNSIQNSNIQPTHPTPAFTLKSFACLNESLSFNAGSTAAVGPVTYSWNFGDGTVAPGLTTPITTHTFLTDNTTYTVTLVVADKYGCTDSVKHTVLIDDPKAAFSSAVISQSCGNSVIKFTDLTTGTGVNPGGTFSWSFTNGASSQFQSPQVTFNQAGIYDATLVVTNSAGCKDTVTLDSIIVVPGPYGTFTFSPTTGCKPLTVFFHGSSNNSLGYSWDFGDGTVITSADTLVQHTYTRDATYTPILLLTDTLPDGTPCQLPATNLTGNVVVSTLLAVDIDSSAITLDAGEEITLNATVSNNTGSVTYSWTPSTGLSCTDCEDPLLTGTGSGETITYYLSIKESGGCEDVDSVKIYNPLCELDKFKVPNVFTPNGDTKNDLFDITGLCLIQKYSIKIYDRWGIEMFESEDRKISWNGKNKSGKDVSDGVYYYIIILDGKPYTGFVHVMR